MADPHPAWRHQWCDLPAEALTRRGTRVRRVSLTNPAAEKPWASGSVVVALLGAVGKVLELAGSEDAVLAVVPDDVWTSDAVAVELGMTSSQHAALVETCSAQVRAVAAVAAGSERLAEIVRAMNPNVVLLPFAAPREREWPAVSPRPGQRIGWVGSRGGREADFEVLLPAFERLARKHDDLKFVFWGTAPSWAGELGARLETYPHELIEMPRYYRTLAGMGLSLALAPLAETPYNESRSRAKFIEAAAGAGCPLVCSDFGPYRRLAAAGAPIVTVADESKAWYEAIDDLLQDEEQRSEIARAARAWVAKHATIDSVVDDWLRAVEATHPRGSGEGVTLHGLPQADPTGGPGGLGSEA